MRKKHFVFGLIGMIIVLTSLSSGVGVNWDSNSGNETSNSLEISSVAILDNNKVSRVVIFVLDGFKPNLLDKADLSTLSWMKKAGINVSRAIPPNPTVTAVGHTSIATGAWAGTHGILGNSFYDWNDQKTYSLFDNSPTDPLFPYIRFPTTVAESVDKVQVEPIFVTLERLGMKTAVIDWPYSMGKWPDSSGYGASIQISYAQLRANYQYEDDIITKITADTIINNPELKLIFSRLPSVDSRSHYLGPDSDFVVEEAIDDDVVIKSFFEQLSDAELLNETVVFIVSDHGFSPVTNSNYFLTDQAYFHEALAATQLNDSLLMAHDAYVEYLYFRDPSNPSKPYTNVTKVQEFASYLKDSNAIEAVFVNEEHEKINLLNPSRQVNISVWLRPEYTRHFGAEFKGMHGTLNNITSQHSLFLAAGPGIHRGKKLSEIPTLMDIAPTTMKLVGVDMSSLSYDGKILSEALGNRSSAFSYPDLYGPIISGLSHSPKEPMAGLNIIITASLSDWTEVGGADLFYSLDDGLTYTEIPMTSTDGTSYSGTIPGAAPGMKVKYYVESYDTLGSPPMIEIKSPQNGTTINEAKVLVDVSVDPGISPNFRKSAIQSVQVAGLQNNILSTDPLSSDYSKFSLMSEDGIVEIQLDDGDWKEAELNTSTQAYQVQFENLSPGLHTINARFVTPWKSEATTNIQFTYEEISQSSSMTTSVPVLNTTSTTTTTSASTPAWLLPTIILGLGTTVILRKRSKER